MEFESPLPADLQTVLDELIARTKPKDEQA